MANILKIKSPKFQLLFFTVGWIAVVYAFSYSYLDLSIPPIFLIYPGIVILLLPIFLATLFVINKNLFKKIYSAINLIAISVVFSYYLSIALSVLDDHLYGYGTYSHATAGVAMSAGPSFSILVGGIIGGNLLRLNWYLFLVPLVLFGVILAPLVNYYGFPEWYWSLLMASSVPWVIGCLLGAFFRKLWIAYKEKRAFSK